MNQSFKSLWNESAGAYVAAPETAKASGSHTSSSRKASRALARSPTQRLALEPRIVFDGALPIAVIDTFDSHVNEQHVAEVTPAVVAQNTVTHAQQPAEKDATKDTAKATETSATSEQITPQERSLIDGTLAPTNLTSHEIIFIDAMVADLQQYIADHPSADVVLLDSTKDALDQIAATLSGRTDISAIHILSHGSSGELAIGDGVLNLQNLTAGSHANDLAVIQAALTDNADILIYGCNVASGANGQAFIAALAASTGADIAASTDLTGAADLGGNWLLENQVGIVDTHIIEAADWEHLMVNTIINPAGGVNTTGADGLRIFVTNLGQIQVRYQNANQLYEPNTTETSVNLFNGIYMAVGNQVVGPDTGAEGITKVAWKSGGTQTLTGTGTLADPFIVTTKLYYDVNNNNVYNAATDFEAQVRTIYSLPNKYFSESVTVTAPVTNTAAIKFYHALDTFLAGGDNGPAFSLDPALAQTNNTAGDPNFVGVRKGVGTVNESMVGFVETGSIQFDHYYSGLYSGASLYGSGTGNGVGIAGGGDIANTWDTNLATDNGLGVQMNLGVLTAPKTFNYIIAFDGDTQLDLDANNSTTTGTSYLGTFSPGTSSEVSVVDTDVLITNVIGDIPDIMVTLTNPQVGDLFTINAALLPAGITVEAQSANRIRLVGIASESAYQAALQLIKFSTSGSSAVDRVFTVAVHNQLNSSVTTATSTLTARAEPIVDLNSGIATSAVAITANAVINTGFSDFADVPYGWVEGGTAAGMVADGATTGRYVFTATAADTLSQSGLFGLNQGPGLNGAGQLSLDLGYLHGDNAARTMDISVGGVVYARLTTGLGTGAGGSVTYLNGATNIAGNATATSISQMTGASGALLNVTINLPSSVAASGNILFTTSSAADDIYIDNVLLRTSTTTLTDVTNGNDFTTTFTEGGAAVSIADIDNTVRDGDSANMVSGLITLTNAQASDQLLVGGSSAASGTINGIVYTNTGTIVTLTGPATKASYEATIRAITFNNTSTNPSTAPRIVTVIVNDGTFVSNTAIATINIVPVNDAPTIVAPATLTATEDVPFAVTGITLADVDAGTAAVNVTLSVNAGTLAWSTATGVTVVSGAGTGILVLSGSIADINVAIAASKLTFNQVADFNNSLGGIVTLISSINDNGNTGGGALTASATTTIQVTPVADAVNDAVSVNEGSPITFNAITGVGGGSADNFESASRAVTAVTQGANGTVTFAADGTMTYTPATDFAGTDTFTYTVTSGGVTETATVTVTVKPVNDAPAGTDKTITIAEDSAPYVVAAADFGFTDPIDTPANTFINVIVTSRPPATDGVYKLNGVAISTGQIITVADINLGLLTFTPTLNKSGTTLGALGFKVQDNGGVLNGGVDTDQSANTLNFNITAVNDAPTVVLPALGTLSAVEDTALILSNITLADVDASTGSETVVITIGAGTGTLNWTATPFVGVSGNGTGTITLTGQINAIKNAIATANALSYIPTADFNGTTPLTVTINDNGNTGTGGALSATATSNITVTPVADVVNDAITTNEDTPITFNVLTNLPANGASADNFENAAAAVTATSTPAHGTVIFNAAGSLVYTPANNYNGTDTFTYTVTSGGVTETATVTVTINSVNDAPTGANNTAPATEDVPYTVSAANFGFADANDTPANAFTNIIISGALPPATQGVYQLNGLAITNGQIVSVADIATGLLKFVPAPNFNGNGVAALIFKVQDNGGTANLGVDTSVATNTFTLNIAPVDDAVTFGNLTNGTVAGTDAQVKESALATGSNPTGTAEAATSTFNVGPDTSLAATGTALSINGTNVTKAQLAAASTGTPITIAGSNGALSITAYNATTGAVTYTYTLTSAANHTGNITVNDSFALIATDVEGQTSAGTLAINILDDAPVAVSDVDEAINLSGNPSSTASGNVVTGIGGTDPNSADGNVDQVGADANASPVTSITNSLSVAGTLDGTTPLAGLHGSLTMAANGSYTYTPNYTDLAVQNLAPGATLSDTFTYQITDGDGDPASTTLTITIVGVPAIIGLNDGTVAGTDGSVFESNLATGTNPTGVGETLAGTFELASPTFGVNSLTIAGTTITAAQLAASATTPITIITANGTLVINGYTQGAAPSGVVTLPGSIFGGTVNYTYTLLTPPASATAVTDDFNVSMIDGANNDTASGSPKILKIAIIDDAPIANSDVDSVTEAGTTAGTPIATGNVVTSIDIASPDSNITDGVADALGADGAAVGGPIAAIAAGTGAPVGGVNAGVLSTNGYGTLTMQANGDYSYVLDNTNATVNALKAGQTLNDTFTYQITDKDGNSATTTLTITINGANDAPVALTDTLNTNEDTTLALNLLANDTDVDGDTLSIKSINNILLVPGTAQIIVVPNGTVTVSAGGVITFNPAPDYYGPVTFNYVLQDGHGGEATAAVNITVTAVADITADSITTSSTAPITFNPLTGTNGATPDAFENPAAAITAVGTATHGTVSLNPDGTISYTPTPGYVGADSFTYTVTSNGVTETATITVGVTNAAPVANPDTGSVAEDSTLTVAASPTTGLLANDTDTDLGDSKAVSQFVVNGVTVLVDPATGGSTTLAGIGSISINADGSYSFVPAADFNGSVPTITYTVKDTAGATATSTLILTVTAVNDAPVGVADVKTTPEDTPATGNVLTNDSDVDVGTTLNVTQFTIPGVGTFAAGTTATIPGKGDLVINSDGSYTFTPALNFNGALPQVAYTITDNSGAVNQTATSTLDISVTPVNDPPVAINDPVTTNEDTPVVLNLAGNDTDIDGDTLTVKSINGTAITTGTAQVITVPNGVVNVSAAGVVTFTPNPNYYGPATFDYVVQDSKGGEDTGTVNITVTPVNDPPVATPVTPNGNEDTPILVNLAGTDLDGTITSVTVTSLPSAAQGILTKADGTPVVAGAPLTPAEAAGLIFKPAPNFNGVVDAITFTVTDNQGAVSLPATVDITIAPVNDAPVAVNASINTLEDIPANVNLAGTDIDGTIATVKVTTLPTAAQGVLYLADGVTPVTTAMNLTATEAASLKFVPTLNFNGLVNIPFTVIDDLGLPAAAPGNFLIDVADVNDAPIATPTTVTGTEDTPTPVNLTGTDVDGTVTKVAVTNLPPATEGILYLADGVTPVIAGQALTAAQAASLVFKPAPNFNGTVTIPFTVTDNSNELSTPANLIINIGVVNDAPIVAPDVQVVNEDTVATGNVLTNDSDIEASPLTVTQFVIPGVGTFATGTTATIPNVGTVTIAANGDYTFTPALNFNGAVPQITYTVSDGVNASNTTLDLTVIAVNDPPAAFPVSPTGNEDTPIVVNLSGLDIDGTVTSVSVAALPPATQGILYLADGVTPVVANVPLTPAQAAGLVFKPALNFNGAVTIPFTVTDNQGLTSAPANADITVNPVNDPPIATPVAPSGNEDTLIPVNLTGSDVDGAIASVTVTSLPPATQGILTKADGKPVVAGVALTPLEAAGLIFVPAPNFNGAVNIPFTVTDNLGAISTPANANITVNAVNDPPVAISDSANTPEDTNVAVTLMGTDVDGTIATVTVTTLPLASQGILTKADGSPVFAGVPLTPAEAAGLIFTPALNFNGIVNIQFIATDNTGAPSTPANFTIDVGAVNDDPIATPATVIGAEDTPIPVTLTGTDTEDGTVTSISVVTLPPASQGILYLADGVTPVVAGVDYPAGGFIFKPAPNFNGSVAIPFTVKDSQGQVSSPPANVNINIGAENDPPVAISGAASGNEDTPIPVKLTGTDVDGTVAGVTVTTLPLASQGVLTLANGTPVAAGAVLTPAQASGLIFVPIHNFVGTVNIAFTVTDNGGATSVPVTTMIDVKDVVSPPTATPINAVGSSEDKILLSLTGSDVDGTIASITIKALPPASQGILTLADGSPVVAGVALTSAQAAGLIFKPNPAFNGTATILFTVTDDEGLESPTASATVKVTAVGNQFEDLIPKNGPYIPYPTLPIATPVLPIGMPENLFVIHSVRESQNVVAQNSGLGVFNADAPTLAELNNFTFDLKGLPIGMDPNLFVQHAVRGVPVVFEPNLFVQNAVRQSQLESTARNIGVTSFNSATNAVTSLMAPFDLGAPNQDVNDFAVDGVKGEFVAASLVNVPEANKQAAAGRVGLEKMISQVDALAKPVASDSLTEKTSLEASKNMQVNKKVAAASFANQLNAAAKRFKANTFIAKN